MHNSILAGPALRELPVRGEAETLQQRMNKFFGALDSLDADATAAFFAPGATVRLPGTEPLVGQSVIRRALVEFSLCVDDLRHESVQLWIAGQMSVFEADVTVKLADRPALTFPVTHIVRWRDGLIQEATVEIYMEARLAVAMSAFNRLRTSQPGARKLA